jgi:hypothetical protein
MNITTYNLYQLVDVAHNLENSVKHLNNILHCSTIQT